MKILGFKLTLLFFAMSLLACSNSTQSEAASENKKVDVGRAETQTIRSTEHIGYAGNAISANVDTVLDENDKRKDDLDKQIDEQSNDTEKPEQ